MTSQHQPRIVGNDVLAKQLMDCAILVKKGERGPILNETIQQLIEYVTAPTSSNTTSSTIPAVVPQQNTIPQASNTSTTVGKHISPLMAMGKFVGLSTGNNDDQQYVARSDASKKATSQKNADRVKADLADLRIGQQQQQAQQQSAQPPHSPHQSQSQPANRKPTTRILGGHHADGDWCEEHFTMGCQCKQRKQGVGGGGGGKTPDPVTTTGAGSTTSSIASDQQPRSKPTGGRKPPFQRPVNVKSTLIANGWIEQQRRSKMRTTWKLVLASLVEGRKAGEETTLWIQREIMGTDGKPQLEALHQIPIKWITDIEYSRHSSEGKFTLKVNNINEEFTFRTKDEDSAQNWVLTLRSTKDGSKLLQGRTASSSEASATALDQEWDGPKNSSNGEEKKVERVTPPPRKLPLRPTMSEEQRNGGGGSAAAVPIAPSQSSPDSRRPDHPPAPPSAQQPTTAIPPPAVYAAPAASAPPSSTTSNGGRMSVKELRAIAHGAGVSTVGMERSQLEAVVAHILKTSSNGNSNTPPQTTPTNASATAPVAGPTPQPPPPPPPPSTVTPPPPPQAATVATPSFKPVEETASDRRKNTDEDVKRPASAEPTPNADDAKRAEEDQHRRTIAERVREQQEMERKKREEEERRRAEEDRIRREEEDHRRRVAEQQAAEQRRRQEEAIRLQQQQWQAVQNQQAEELRRRHLEEQRMAERMAEHQRMQEEAYRRQQQWNPQQQSQPPQHPAHQYPPHHHQGPPPPSQQHQWHQQQQQRPPYPMPQGQPPQGFVPPPTNQHFHNGPQQQPHQHHPKQPYPGVPPHGHAAPPQQPSPQQQASSQANMKYAKMVNQTTDDRGQAIQMIKHAVLINWALQPPMLQSLRPIEVLLSTVHNVLPPNFGVTGHDYFTKWSPIPPDDVTTGNRPDTDKLNKSVRKFRFFLHPDKLPRDMTDEQKFMCKMVWDIMSDAYEDYKKKEEELGWIRT